MKFLFFTMLAALPAFPLTITFDDSVPHLSQMINLRLDGDRVDVNAGQIGVRFDGTIPAVVFCADPLTSLELGPTAVTPVLETSFVNGPRLAWLYNTYSPTLTEGWQAAALQLVIWEVILDNNSDDLSSGRARTTDDTDSRVVTLADSMLAASAGQTSSGVTFWVPDSGPSASQTLFASSIAYLPAPEPFNGMLFSAGLLMIGALRLRAK
jgi:hypothetical protein